MYPGGRKWWLPVRKRGGGKPRAKQRDIAFFVYQMIKIINALYPKNLKPIGRNQRSEKNFTLFQMGVYIWTEPNNIWTQTLCNKNQIQHFYIPCDCETPLQQIESWKLHFVNCQWNNKSFMSTWFKRKRKMFCTTNLNSPGSSPNSTLCWKNSKSPLLWEKLQIPFGNLTSIKLATFSILYSTTLRSSFMKNIVHNKSCANVRNFTSPEHH